MVHAALKNLVVKAILKCTMLFLFIDFPIVRRFHHEMELFTESIHHNCTLEFLRVHHLNIFLYYSKSFISGLQRKFGIVVPRALCGVPRSGTSGGPDRIHGASEYDTDLYQDISLQPRSQRQCQKLQTGTRILNAQRSFFPETTVQFSSWRVQ